MSSSTVHYNDSTTQTILITDLNPSTPSSSNDVLEDREIVTGAGLDSEQT